MPRTKRRFEDVSASSQPTKSQPAVEPMMEEVEASDMSHPMSRGGGKMMFLQRPGKQIRNLVEQEDDSEEEDDVEEEEEEEVAYPPAQRGGKAFRHMGGKQLSLPLVAHESSEDEEDDDEDTDEIAPVVVPQPSNRASGKSLVNMQSLGGKQFRPPFPVQEEDDDDDDDDDDDSENEPEETRLVRLGSGKMLATAKSATQTKSTIVNTQVGETEDMDVDSNEDTDKINPTDKNKTSAINQQIQSQLSSSNNKGKDTGNKKLASTVSKAEFQPAKKSVLKKRVVLDESDEDKDDFFDNDLSDDDKESKEEPDEEEDMDPEDLQQHHLIQDEADQKYLDSLPELEREEILAERYEKRKNELEMKKVLKEQRQRELGLKTSSQGKGTNSKKNSVSKKLSSSTKKTVLENSYSALKSTQKAKKAAARAEIRETRAAAAAAKNAKQQKTRFTEEDEASDLDYGSEDNDDSDEDYDEKPWAMKKVTDVKSSDTIKDTSKAISSRNLSGGFEVDNKDEEENSRPAPRQVILADYADYKMVTIPRRRLSRWCHEPFFEKAIQNYYVRVTGGRDPMTQKPFYNFCKIIGVVVKENLEYEFPAEPGKPIVKTNKHLKVIIGTSEKERPMNLVSDSPPLSDEVNFFVSSMKLHRLDDELVSKKEALKMKELQEKLISNYQYTEQEIDQAVKTKKALTNTVANIGAEKMKVALAVQAAQQSLDESRLKVDDITKKFLEAYDGGQKLSLEKELTDEKNILSKNEAVLQRCLEEEKKILSAEEIRKNRMKQSNKIQNWVKVNERAKAANKNADVEAYKVELERMSLGGKDKDFDPYARRKARPQILWDVGIDKIDQKDDTEQSLEISDSMKADSAGLQRNADKGELKLNEVHKPFESAIGHAANKMSLKSTDEIHDVAIDEELIARNNIQLGVSQSNKGSSLLGRVRKGLSLDEYLMKKAAGTL